MTPKRIQRKRSKGWKMPEGAVSVTRPGKWGNPFKVGGYFRIVHKSLGDSISTEGRGGFTYLQCLLTEYLDPSFALIDTSAKAVEFYRRYVELYPRKNIEELRGKDLACWCPLVDKDGKPVPCHADVLLEIANQ